MSFGFGFGFPPNATTVPSAHPRHSTPAMAVVGGRRYVFFTSGTRVRSSALGVSGC